MRRRSSGLGSGVMIIAAQHAPYCAAFTPRFNAWGQPPSNTRAVEEPGSAGALSHFWPPNTGVRRLNARRHRDGSGAPLRRSERVGADQGPPGDIMQQISQILERDLPLQYEKPQDLSIFSNGIEFQDPVTTLRGKLAYRGMLFVTLLFFRVACNAATSYFNVLEINRSSDRTIQTVWETGATTRNGRDLFISGVDEFTVNEKGQVSRHDSEWDQTWDEVRNQIL